ncbi:MULTISPECIES: nucleotidyl transferase AbiEii/AbiGii toxin family protein [unclassified Rhizobium]|uniref:nucleotidyl transferase AbiEii/AbiGii toxin family protein n=1 Tax=unclassified Rhizobium TaxID=2613769 RepID=UPI001833CE8B|nr:MULTISPECIES: nucleotidyl transferase AbiEii/AbiGii toxin family protein [unclassified Rhizobium]MBB3396993.1 putative nucleotidyltransferase component of viral defense system [Rhizobium sp. BK060]
MAAIHDVEVDGLTLAFGGGTALGRAYRLLERMSEDIDLRIIGEKSNSRSVLKRLRGEVNDRLSAAGFAVEGHYEVKQSDKYVRYDLPYEPIAKGEGVLRPEIKIELSTFPVSTEPEMRSVSSFITEANRAEAEAIDVKCVRLVETAADKFVALARRPGFAFSGLGPLDHTLVRHIYDLSRMDGHYDLDAAVVIALEIMKTEAAARAGDYPAYKENPKAETLRTYKIMAGDTKFAEGYAKLLGDLVYGQRPDFEEAFTAAQRFAERLDNAGTRRRQTSGWMSSMETLICTAFAVEHCTNEQGRTTIVKKAARLGHWIRLDRPDGDLTACAAVAT